MSENAHFIPILSVKKLDLLHSRLRRSKTPTDFYGLFQKVKWRGATQEKKTKTCRPYQNFSKNEAAGAMAEVELEKSNPRKKKFLQMRKPFKIKAE